jgi:hypothetical protein
MVRFEHLDPSLMHAMIADLEAELRDAQQELNLDLRPDSWF